VQKRHISARLRLVSSIAVSRHTLGKSLAGLLGELLELLGLESGGLGELEDDAVSGESLVSVGEGLKTVGHDLSVEGVKEDLLLALSVNGDADLAAGHEGGGHDIVKDGVVDSLEGTGAGSLLGSVGDGSGGDDGAVGNHNDGPLELSLEVIDDVLADLAEGLEGSVGDSDEDVLAHGAVSLLVFNLLGGGNVDESEVGLEVSVGLLEVLKGLGELLLEFGSLGVGLLHELGSVEHLVVSRLIIINKPASLILDTLNNHCKFNLPV